MKRYGLHVTPPARPFIGTLVGALLVVLLVREAVESPPAETPPQGELPTAEPPAALPRQLDVQGHRGARGLEPENTLVGFDAALRLGVSTLELDVGTTRDGAVVVTHDPFIRTDLCLAPGGEVIEGARGPLLIDSTLEQVQSFDCGTLNPDPGRFPTPPRERRPGERIPTLGEVFDLARQRSHDSVRFNVEIKAAPGSGQTRPLEDFVARVIDVVRKYDAVERTTIQSFDWRALELAKRREPRIELAALLADDTTGPEWNAGLVAAPGEPLAEWVGRLRVPIDDFSPDYRLLLADPEAAERTIASFHRAGVRVIPWTVNDTKVMARLIDLGVDGIITDRPDLLLALCQAGAIAVGHRSLRAEASEPDLPVEAAGRDLE